MKKILILGMLTFTVFIFSAFPVMGQNESVGDTTKQDTFIYTCSMHPEIQLKQSGICPKCGMELVKTSAVSEKKQKKRKMKMMHTMMNGTSHMSGMGNAVINNSVGKNNISSDSAQKEAFFYTCSMHPEIQSGQPGICPKCGMELIKKLAISGQKEKRHKMSAIGMGMGIGMGAMMAGMLFFLIIR